MIAPLADGPLDVVGDVHGDDAGLLRLLDRLGYRADGRHPAGRRLVFVGDLVDRGSDSVAVARRVAEWVAAGRAHVVLGNHELNLLLGKRRPGNEWFYGEPQYDREGRLLPQRLAVAGERRELLAFFATLPLALERDDLRVVHACWHAPAVQALRAVTDAVAQQRCCAAAIEARHNGHGSLAQELALQNENPVLVLTSGLERAARQPFQAGGRMRYTERVRWWNEYQSQELVVFGHYWRSRDPQRRLSSRSYDFEGTSPWEGLGPRRTAWCVDYSNGHRLAEQVQRGGVETVAALAALRVPERELVLA